MAYFPHLKTKRIAHKETNLNRPPFCSQSLCTSNAEGRLGCHKGVAVLRGNNKDFERPGSLGLGASCCDWRDLPSALNPPSFSSSPMMMMMMAGWLAAGVEIAGGASLSAELPPSLWLKEKKCVAGPHPLFG